MTTETKRARDALRRRSATPPPKERFEVLIEEMRSDFKVVAEGQSALARRMDEHERRNEEHELKTDRRFQDLQTFVFGVAGDLTLKIEGVRTNLTAKIDGVEEKLTAKIDGVEKRLGERIDAVGKDLASHRADTEIHHSQYRVSE